MENKLLDVIGLMSGTSMDGIDISFVKTNGKNLYRFNKNYFFPYSENLKDKLKKYLSCVHMYKDFKDELDKSITVEFIKALKKTNIIENAQLIGFHGQTIFHNPDKKISVQLGDPELLAKTFKKNIVFNFRQKDILNGGQGAPISPIYHKFIINENNLSLPSCVINIGGISNLTYWCGKKLISFDTGPGNFLIDKYVHETFNVNYDDKGNLASQGKINIKFLEKFLLESFFKKKFPKSLDVEFFNKIYLDVKKTKLDPLNVVATLTEMTLSTLIIGINMLPRKPKNIVLCGGGANNLYLVKKLKQSVNASFFDLNKISQNLTNYLEAEMIAYLAARSYYNLPITFPSTTGVSKPVSGGELFLSS